MDQSVENNWLVLHQQDHSINPLKKQVLHGTFATSWLAG
jgi:hypothetical protein